ncbi:MAG: cobalamin biosynthesis protein CobQ [Henriciella sp.]|nr:cobalamin biosynthesis protein CobQ [Henriciella sp.]
MNTVAHMVIASAALASPNAPKRNWAVLIGALIPDASMFVFFAWSRLQGWSGDETWNVQYWIEPWQTLGAVSNSLALFGALLILALWRKWSLWSVLASAALLHIALDFPLHADDAHRHFWPISDWRFFSPVSYWDPAHNGLIGGAIETVSMLFAAGVLWWRFTNARWRLLFASLASLQLLAFGMQITWTVLN